MYQQQNIISRERIGWFLIDFELGSGLVIKANNDWRDEYDLKLQCVAILTFPSYALILTFDALTSDLCIVSTVAWSNSVLNCSEIKQFEAEL